MTEYTPEYVREEYARSITPSTQAQLEYKFDQMLKRVKAEAWDEGFDGGVDHCVLKQNVFNPYREETE